MQVIQLRMCLVLLIITVHSTTLGITAGCEDWSLHRTSGICCKRCSPGNHLVTECGNDHSVLCTPCEPNTYTDRSLAWSCKTCTQCIVPQVMLKPCNSTADTVCGCGPGFRCGNELCHYCVKECKEGQEPTNERTCRKCPEGTFNDKIHSPCKPWRTSCPEGEHITASGTEFSDITCSKITETSTLKEITTVTKPTKEKTNTDNDSLFLLIGIFGGSAALMISFIGLLWYICQNTTNKNKSKDQKPAMPRQDELTIMMVDHEEPCSFHQPQQEQGGSSESINTQDSETKLIV